MTLSNAITAIMIVLGVWLWNGWSAAERRAEEAVAREKTEEAMRDIEKRRDEIREEILNGGEDDLDDYSRGIGERLWGGR